MNFANQIKELRKNRNIRQDELAQIVDVGRTSVGKWENGNNYPTVEVLDKLATYFGVTTDYLLGRDNLPATKRNALDFKMLEEFNSLNDFGKREAIKRISELSHLPMYCNKEREMPIAAHNDAVIDEKELRLMQEDIDEL